MTRDEWEKSQPDIRNLLGEVWKQRMRDKTWAQGRITFDADTVAHLIERLWEVTKERNDLAEQLATLKNFYGMEDPAE